MYIKFIQIGEFLHIYVYVTTTHIKIQNISSSLMSDHYSDFSPHR